MLVNISFFFPFFSFNLLIFFIRLIYQFFYVYIYFWYAHNGSNLSVIGEMFMRK